MTLSLAYQDSVNIPDNKEYESIDLLSSGVKNVSLDNYQNLIRIRISFCEKLEAVTLTNMPKLQVLDVIGNKNLQSVKLDKCPSLIAIEAGYNSSLIKIDGITNIQYLSAPYSYKLELQDLPNIVYLDVSTAFWQPKNINVHELLQKCPKLECLISSVNDTLKLSEITKHPSLQVLQIQAAKIKCDSIDDQTKLKIIIFDGSTNYASCFITEKDEKKQEEEEEEEESEDDDEVDKLLSTFYVTDLDDSNHEDENPIKFIDIVPKYQSYQRLFYGPWGIPEVDMKEPVKVDHAIVKPPDGMNHEKAADSIVGSIMASAVMDMVGVGVEFINGCMAKPLLLGPANITWSHPRSSKFNAAYVRGTPTDDTSQNVLIMRTIVDCNKSQQTTTDNKEDKSENPSRAFVFKNVRIDPCNFGEKLNDWIHRGHVEHKHHEGLGCGTTTADVTKHKSYKTDPISAAKDVWIQSGKNSAPNGSIMRIASSGCFAFWDDEIVIKQAETYAKVTHADPRCIYSSIAAALIIARYIRWNAGIGGNGEPNIDKILSFAKKFVPEIGNYENELNYYLNCKTVEELKLSEHRHIGYVLKAFGSAVWALRYCDSYQEAMQKILPEGGDADTNGAVVGALLGAKFGFKAIPAEYVELMFVGQWMFREMTPFMNLMGIEMPPSPYIKK